jgi:Na+-driven multidrug efflux pump
MTPVAKALGIPRMGMLGAAWATIIARAIVLVPTAMVLAKRFRIVVPERGRRGPDSAELRRIVRLAWPSSAQFVIRISAMLLVNALVARYFTTQADQTATTAMGLVFRLDTMALFVAMGWGSAAQTFVGQNLGAKQTARATRSGWIAAAYDAFTNIVLIALSYLRIVAPTYVGLGVGIVLGNTMAGAGATRTTFIVDVLVIMLFQFPLSIISVAGFGASIEGLFRCVAITNALSAIAYSLVYLRGRWTLAAPAGLSVPPPPAV